MAGRATLSRQHILRVALELIDAQGLTKFSIKKLANQLGVYPTAVTWHVGSKDELITALTALIFDDVKLPDDRDTDWAEWLLDTARVVRSHMHRHPNLVPIAGSTLTPVPPSLPFVERVLRVLIRAGHEGDGLLHAYNAFVGALLGWVSIELSRPSLSPERARAKYERDLGEIDPNLYTAVVEYRELLSDRAFLVRWSNGVNNPMNASFDVMIRALIEGIRPRAQQAS